MCARVYVCLRVCVAGAGAAFALADIFMFYAKFTVTVWVNTFAAVAARVLRQQTSECQVRCPCYTKKSSPKIKIPSVFFAPFGRQRHA